MDLTGFIDFDFNSPVARQSFLDLNALNHETIFNTMLAAGNLITHYPLYVTGVPNDDWIDTHAAEHQGISDALNLATPPGLGDVDLSDPSQVIDWLQYHAQHHDLIAQTLGL